MIETADHIDSPTGIPNASPFVVFASFDESALVGVIPLRIGNHSLGRNLAHLNL